MKRFAALIDRLIYTRSRNTKLALIVDYLRHTADPDRGWAIAALTESLDFPAVKAGTVRALLATRVDEELFRLSRHFVGDTAETAALLWPESNPVRGEERLSPAKARLEPPAAALRDAPSTSSGAPQDKRISISVAEAVDALSAATRSDAPAIVASLLDRLDADGRYALLKLALGGMRVGVSARLAKQAFAQAFEVPVDDVEELWHAIPPPYAPLFAWGEGRAERPDLADVAFFRPFMLAHPLEGESVDLADYAAEWKWDGIRVQIVRGGSETRIYSRGGEEIGGAFPELVAAFDQDAVIDGELLVRGEVQGGPESQGGAASFNALQQRLGRKNVSKKMLVDYPAFVRVYDLLAVDGNDLRNLPWTERRRQLEAFVLRLADSHFDLSQVIDAKDFDDLAERRAGARDAAIEGVMLKRRDAPYVAGRRAGLWYKWKRDPLTADCVMMYAQRGNGRRASFYSDYTFGCWSDAGELLPVGKAYSGFTDEELKWLDKFVRDNTLNRFGPVREVEKSLVLEVAFDSIHASKRHKSGLAMRFPRIARIRRDKPAEEADRIATLQAMVT
ncbi:cisplatin damage response ATP-dependent DNA ligase [Sphingopyxis sp.]|uniref:cisplatin damage response ATP-dependent DNA ligase n=1 Tax=Sphingopyxis sp. TaxID=1908224 RepID=UPI002FC94094